MKKLITFFTLLTITTTSVLAGHLNFLGFTIDGPYAEFQKKLAGRNIVLESEPMPGISVFKGVFAGEESTIIVTSAPKSTTVTGVTVTNSYEDKDAAIKRYKYFITSIQANYRLLSVKPAKGDNDDESITFSVDNGMIIVSLKQSQEKWSTEITYLDVENSRRFNAEKQSDI